MIKIVFFRFQTVLTVVIDGAYWESMTKDDPRRRLTSYYVTVRSSILFYSIKLVRRP